MNNDRETSYHFRHMTPTHVRNVANQDVFKMDYEVVADAGASTTEFDGVRLGSIDIYRWAGYGQRRSHRNVHHISSDGIDDFVICLPLAGRIDIDQNGVRADVHPGQFAIQPTSTPFSGSITGARPRESFACLQARVAGSALRARVQSIETSCDQPIQIRSGAGSIMQSLFDIAVREASGLSADEASQLGGMVTDMVANSILGAPELRPGGIGRSNSPPSLSKILKKAQIFIESQLTEPDLDVTRIAAHCHVSLRSLQLAFATVGTTVVRHVRQRRLERCRQVLCDPFNEERSVTGVAMSWGFNDLAYFSRAYRAHFGVTPSQDLAARAARRTATGVRIYS